MMEIISIHHSGFAIITERIVVIIDYFKDPYCIIPPLLKTGRSVYVLSSHRHQDHFNEEVLAWSNLCSDIKYIFSSDIKRVLKRKENGLLNSVCFIKRDDIYRDTNLKVHAFGSTDVGVSFLLELDERVLFHAGDLNNWHWEKESTYQEIKKAEGDFMAILRDISKCVEAFDVAMFPVDARMHGDYARGARQFLQQFKVDDFIPMHTWGLWKEACDFSVYKNDKFGKYVCLKDGESLSLKKLKTRTMEIRAKFDHFNFNVSDLERSIGFYNKALNLRESHRINAKDGSFIIVYLKDQESGFLLELTWLREHPQRYDLGECEFHLCVRAAGDYDEVRAYHKKLGIVCYENTDMGLYFIEDPDGYWIEVLPQK